MSRNRTMPATEPSAASACVPAPTSPALSTQADLASSPLH
uniref:Uncharacterized protein n=1 Tax=Arundo donax TaxID=35708 RepID=A0A0A9E0A6_ARUDO